MVLFSEEVEASKSLSILSRNPVELLCKDTTCDCDIKTDIAVISYDSSATGNLHHSRLSFKIREETFFVNYKLLEHLRNASKDTYEFEVSDSLYLTPDSALTLYEGLKYLIATRQISIGSIIYY